MPMKKWLLCFFLSLLGGVLLLAGVNLAVDPFGVFGDGLYDWYAYNMTQNPRVAKVAWLDRHHGDYNAYVIGSSKASSLSVETLNAYTGDSWYNMTWYGEDLQDELQLVEYLLALDEDVEHLILTLDPQSAYVYGAGSPTDLKECMHAKLSGEPLLPFYGRYLFANLSYSWDKVLHHARKGVLLDASHVYLPESGCYNKSVRDATPINDLSAYLALEGMAETVENKSMDFVAPALAAAERIRDLCREKGVNFTLLGLPISEAELEAYPREGVEALWRGAAEIAEFYCYWGRSSVNSDLRYYYDALHFRNAVGDMVLARLFDDERVYVPADFGVLSTPETVDGQIEAAYSGTGAMTAEHAALPILMYHAFTDDPAKAGGTTAYTGDFEAQLQALQAAGYEAVDYADVIAYVEGFGTLPEKPVLITFDDGYRDNLTLAAPLLERYGFTANIAVIGVSLGKDSYKDSGTAITPHFALDEAQAWVERGVITVSSHSYDLHQVPALDGEGCREGMIRLKGESEADYAAALEHDARQMDGLLAQLDGVPPVTTYPYGRRSTLSEVTLQAMGAQVSVTTDPGANVLTRGLPQSLYQLRRINVEGGLDAESLLTLIQSAVDSLS